MARSLLALAFFCAGLAHGAGGPAAAKAPAPISKQAAASQEDITARTVFQVLVGELALQRGEAELGVGAYADLARRTRDPKVIERATEVAGLTRQFEQAHDLAKLWLEVEPTSFKARQTLATILVLLNRTDELAPQLSLLLEQDKENLGENLLRLNRMLARHTDRQAVLRLVEKVTTPYQEMPEAHYSLATAAASAGDQGKALAEIDKAVKLRPDWELAALLNAQLLSRESPAKAIDTLSLFVERNPAASDARLAVARLLIGEKRYDESRRHFQVLLKDNPDRPEVIYPVAMLALQQNDLKTGKEQLEKLLQSDFPDKSTVHYFLGQIDEEQKQVDGAVSHYQQVTSGEQYIPARARAAQMLAQKGDFQAARQVIQTTAGRTDQEKTQLLVAEAQLLRQEKRIDEAYGVIEKALAKQPDNADLLYEGAMLAERQNRLDRMEIHLRHLLKIKPDHAQALNALGYTLADHNLRLTEAHDLISKALALAPEDPFILDSMGWVLFRQGKHEESLKVLSKAYHRKPDPEIAAHLSEVLWTLGRQDDARKLLREAAGKNPDNEVLTAAIKKYLP